jgi:hypothetical protein
VSKKIGAGNLLTCSYPKKISPLRLTDSASPQEGVKKLPHNAFELQNSKAQDSAAVFAKANLNYERVSLASNINYLLSEI